MSAEELTTTTDRLSRELICIPIKNGALLLYDAERVVKMTP
jgi:hypothetical protein